MSGASITVDDRELRAKLKQLVSSLQDMRPVFEEVGQGWRTFVDLCFRQQADPWGNPWEQLSDTTLLIRGQKGIIGQSKHTFEATRAKLRTRQGHTKARALRAIAGAKILQDKGTLRNSMTYIASKDSLAIGTNVVYSAAQFLGMKKGYAGTMRNGRPIPWGDIPPRPAFPICPGGDVNLPSTWSRFLFDTLKRHMSK